MKNLRIVIAAFIIALGLLSFTVSDPYKKNSPKEVALIKGYEIGDEATDFKLKNIDGKLVSLSDYKTAKGFIVIFTCNHCPYAKKI